MGNVHHFLHDTHRVAGWVVHVSIPKGSDWRSIVTWGDWRTRCDVRGQLDTRFDPGALFPSFASRHHYRNLRLWLHRVRFAGMATFMPARLHFELSEDWNDFGVDDWSRCCQSDDASPSCQRVFRLERWPLLQWRDLSFRLYLHHVWCDLGLSCFGIIRDNSKNGFVRERFADDRLRGDADGGDRCRLCIDRGCSHAGGRLLGNQHRSIQNA